MFMTISNLNGQQLSNLINNNNCIISTSYSEDDYRDAITRIQQLTFKDPKIVLGRKWRAILASTFTFMLKLLYKGYNNFLVFPISSHQHKWFEYSEEEFMKYAHSANVPAAVWLGVDYRCDHHRWRHLDIQHNVTNTNNSSIQRYISYLSKVGAIAKVQDSYVDLSNHYMYSSKYIISKERIRELVSLLLTSTYSISHATFTSLSSISSSLSSISTITNPISSSLLSLPPLGSVFVAPPLAKCVKLTQIIDDNNRVLPEEEQISYKGRRAYSEVCSFLNEEKHESIPLGTMTKQMYLDKVFGQNNWFEFDRRGSIYNLTYSLNNKDYLNNEIDIYELMNGKKFADKEERRLFKMTQMSVYFSTARRTVNFFIRNLTNKLSGLPIPQNKEELIQAYWKLCGCDENTDWNEFVTRFYAYYNKRKKQMKKVIGDNKWLIDNGSKYRREAYVRNEDSFIFMHESNVYLEFVNKLRSNKGLRVVQVYDGFYLQKGSITEAELNKILRDVVLNYVGQMYVSDEKDKEISLVKLSRNEQAKLSMQKKRALLKASSTTSGDLTSGAEASDECSLAKGESDRKLKLNENIELNEHVSKTEYLNLNPCIYNNLEILSFANTSLKSSQGQALTDKSKDSNDDKYIIWYNEYKKNITLTNEYIIHAIENDEDKYEAIKFYYGQIIGE